MSVRDDDTIRDSFNTEHEHTPPDSSAREWRRTEKSGISYDTAHGAKTVHPSRLIDKFDDAAAGRSFGDELPKLPLPGHGQRRETCGDDIPRFCSDCGHVTTVGRTCRQSGCPRCWKTWDRVRATKIASKLEALRRYKEASGGPGWQGWKFHHLAISPPEGFAVDSDDPLQRTFDLLKEILGDMNVDTGALFYHPFRGKDGDDRGFWKWLLPDGDEKAMAETEQHLSHEPHFHAVVLAKFVPTEHVAKKVESETGWVIHRITKGDDSDVSLYDQYDLARSVSYCLSHVGIGEGRAAYRYFGEVANFKAEKRIERELDAAVRSVAVNTLGLRYDSQACTDEIINPVGDAREKINLGAAHGAGAAESVETVEVEAVKCEGRLLEITAAPAFLDNDEWMDHAQHVDELRQTWREWRAMIDDDAPEPDPWDIDTG